MITREIKFYLTLTFNKYPLYIKEFFWKYPNIPTFIQFLTSDNEDLNIYIAMLVQKSFELRKPYFCYYN